MNNMCVCVFLQLCFIERNLTCYIKYEYENLNFNLLFYERLIHQPFVDTMICFDHEPNRALNRNPILGEEGDNI